MTMKRILLFLVALLTVSVSMTATDYFVSTTFRNFEVVGIQVNITDHTQSENFRIRNGHHNTFDNIACHDGMGIGFYLTTTTY